MTTDNGDISSISDAVDELLAEDGATEPLSSPKSEETHPEYEPDEFEDGAEEPLSDDETDEGSEGEDGSDEGSEADEATLSDDTKIKRTINGVEQEVSIGELSRVYGLHKAIEADRQFVAENRKHLNEAASHVTVIAQNMLEGAKARLAQFEGINWAQLLVSSPETYELYYNAAKQAQNEVELYSNNLGEAVKAQRLASEQARQEAAVAQARATIATLTGEGSPIPNWSPALYDEVLKGAVTAFKAPANVVGEATELWQLHMMWAANEYMKLQSAKAKAEVVKISPTKIVKSKISSGPTRSGSTDDAALRRKFEADGSMESAVELLMRRARN